MRVVDEETRRIVQKNRLDALEGDHLFDEYNFGGLDQEENNYIDVNEGLQEWGEAEANAQDQASDDDIISGDESKSQASGKDKVAQDAVWDEQWAQKKSSSGNQALKERDPKPGAGPHKNDNQRKTRR